MTPDIPGPVTTEGDVEDDVMIAKVFVDIATSFKFSIRSSPRGGVGVAGGQITRDRVAREEPDADSLRCPVCSVDASTDGVKATTVRAAVVAGDLAPLVGILTRSIDVAVWSADLTTEGAGIADRTARFGMQGHSITSFRVDALDDVDLAAVRPVRAKGPAIVISFVGIKLGRSSQGRPATTLTTRHMLEIKNDKTMSVCLLARQSNTVSPSSPGNIGRVNANNIRAISLVNQSSSLSIVPIEIVHIAMSGIVTLKVSEREPSTYTKHTVKKSNLSKNDLVS